MGANFACSSSKAKPNLLGIPMPSFSSGAADLNDREQRQLDLFDQTVRNPSTDIDPATRRAAAEELIAMDRTEATDRLADALRSGEPAVVTAVIDAMDASPEPVEGLLPAATETLQDAQDDELEKLSSILPRYGNDALQRVSSMARERTNSPAARVGPIYALAAFRSREAAVQLMAILNDTEPEPPEIVAATGASLGRLTGLPYGADADQWRRWWDELKTEPIEDWLRIMVLHLSQRTAELERELNTRTRDSSTVANRLTDVLRELFVSLSADEQLARLPDLMDDDLAPVRAFALGRVERRLRDSEQIPETLQEKLAERLNDPNETAASRLLAARLLSDLNFQGTGYLVAAALAEQKDPQIVRGYLTILIRRPNPAALNQVLLWISDSVAGETAANALWSMLVNRLVEEDHMPTTRRAVRNALEWRTTPPLVRVLGAIGNSDDQRRVEAMLEDADPALRRAAAEGLAFAGELDPLLERINDEAVYPFAIRLIARGPANLATLALLADQRPPAAARQEWAQAIKATADRLGYGDLRAADDALRQHDYVDLQLRVDVLARATEAGPEAMTLDQRSTLLVRLAQLRVELNDYQGAFDALVWPNGAPTSPEFAQMKFEAALLAGRFDDAAALNGDVNEWLAQLDRLIDQRPALAETLRDEIRRRFAAQIQGDAGAVLRAAEQRLTDRATVQANPEASQ